MDKPAQAFLHTPGLSCLEKMQEASDLCDQLGLEIFHYYHSPDEKNKQSDSLCTIQQSCFHLKNFGK